MITHSIKHIVLMEGHFACCGMLKVASLVWKLLKSIINSIHSVPHLLP